MILGDPKRWDAFAADGVYGEITLDGLLQRAAHDHPEDTALSGQDGRGDLRAHTWRDLDRMVSVLADYLLDLGLKQDDPVIILGSASIESVVSLLALSRAGMIAVPVSPSFGPGDVARIAEQLAARAIIAEGHVGPRETGHIAAMAAFSAFDVRFLLGFGTDLPDGVIALDDILARQQEDDHATTAALRGGRAADHVVVMTVDGDGNGEIFAARNHGQLIATALPVIAHARLSHGSVLATPMVPCSLAALSGTVVAWLVAQASLVLLPSWSVAQTGQLAQARGATHVAIPGRLTCSLPDDIRVIRLWRDQVSSAVTTPGSDTDAVSLGEAAIMVFGDDAPRDCIPLSGLRLDPDAKQAILEPRIQGIVHKGDGGMTAGSLLRGPLAVRGPGTPLMAHPRDQAGQARFTENGFMLTGLRGELVQADGPVVRILGQTSDTVRSGSMAIDLDTADTLFAGLGCVEDAAAIAISHDVLGHVLGMAYVGPADVDPETVAAELEGLGCSAHKMPAQLLRVAAIPRDGDGHVRRGAIGRDREAG